MSGQHTPGPWAYRPELHDDWGVVRAGRYWICQAKDPSFIAEEHLSECRANKTDPWEANARLIAAAPDLLAAAIAWEAAEDARNDCDGEDGCDNEGPWEHCPFCSERFGEAIDMRRSAICSAIGEDRS